MTTTALGDSLSLRSLTLFLKSSKAGIRIALTLLQEVRAENIDVSSTKRDVLASLCVSSSPLIFLNIYILVMATLYLHPARMLRNICMGLDE